MKYKSVKDTKELIVKQDYSKEIIFGLDDLPSGGHLLQIVTIPPHTKQRIHSHQTQTEVFYMLSGTCLITVNGQDYHVGLGDAMVCEPGDHHNLWNQGDQPFKLVVFKINLPKEEDTVWEE